MARLFDAYRQFYHQSPDLTGAEAFVSDRLSHGDSDIFLAIDNDDLLGFVQLYPAWSSVSMRSIWILNDLFVAPEARGQGVGEALIEKAIQFGRDSGAVRLTLATQISNQVAQSLYEKLQWQQDREFIHYDYPL